MSKSGSKCAAVAAGVVLLITAAAQAGQAPAPQIVIGNGSGRAGDTLSINVALGLFNNDKTCAVSVPNVNTEAACMNRAGATQFGCDAFEYNTETRVCALSGCYCVAGTQNDIGVAAPLSIPEDDSGAPLCTVNAAINKGGTSFAFVEGGIRALVLALNNTFGLPQATLLYTCQVAIAEDAEPGEYPLPCSNQGSSDPSGGALTTTCTDGVVEVLGPPTATPTDTPIPTATNTPLPTSTGTATATGTVTNTPTVTNTRAGGGFDNDDCAIVAPGQASTGWLLLLPAAALLWLRRRSR